jgi:hypothetical protein
MHPDIAYQAQPQIRTLSNPERFFPKCLITMRDNKSAIGNLGVARGNKDAENQA